MRYKYSYSNHKIRQALSIYRLYYFLAPRSYSVFMVGALFCTLLVKLFHSLRYDLVGEYIGWILADVSFLLIIEVVLALICYRWPRKWVLRTATIIAAVVCTWSVMNAGWLIRTGTQILPTVLLPLVRAPLNSFIIIGVNLARMPKAAVLLLGPSAIALTFFFFVLAKPLIVNYSRKRLLNKVFVCCIIIFATVVVREAILTEQGSAQIAYEELSYNCQLKAVTSLIMPGRRTKTDSAKPKRKIPTFDNIILDFNTHQTRFFHPGF